MIIGIFLNFAASPAVARRIGFGSFHFVQRQIFFAPIAYCLMLFISMQRLRTIRRMAILGYIITLILLILTLLIGVENKGASRWIKILGFSLQPSEFIKPAFAVVAAWLFEGQMKDKSFPGNKISVGLFIVTVAFLLAQPDVGMTIVVSLVWCFQLFLSGISLYLVAGLVFLALLGSLAAYFTFDHVQIRVQQFLASENNLSYQVRKSMEAFQNSNIFGRGPGEGTVKLNIPDAHTDFIFAVAAEEFGIVLCLIIVALFAIVVVHSMRVSTKENNLFIILSAGGLSASFGIQALINLASTLHLMPTKGMTLPFISYGGSSLLATAFGMGMLLAITRRNVSAEEKDEY